MFLCGKKNRIAKFVDNIIFTLRRFRSFGRTQGISSKMNLCLSFAHINFLLNANALKDIRE